MTFARFLTCSLLLVSFHANAGAGNAFYVSANQIPLPAPESAENTAPASCFLLDGYVGPAPLIAYVTDCSSDDYGIVTHQWDHAGGLKSNDVIVYNTPGEYILSLTVTDDNGLTHTATQTVTVLE